MPRSIEGSEQPLLARIHYTNGYRAGISAGKDDPEIAQKGFDDGFPLGAKLAMRVGYLLEMVREVLGPQQTTTRNTIQDATNADGTEDQTKRAGSAAVGTANQDSLTQAEIELDLANLIQEMEGAGMLSSDASRDGNGDGAVAASLSLQACAPSFVDRLPSVMKWTRIVEDLGKMSTHR